MALSSIFVGHGGKQWNELKRRYQYLKAHPGTFKIATKDKRYKQR